MKPNSTIKAYLEAVKELTGKESIGYKVNKKPKKKIQHEAKEQEAVFKWAMMQRCKWPELDLLYAIPNGGSRHLIEAANLKKQGVRSGVPDLCLPVAKGNHFGLYIELKVGKNKTSPMQNEWIDKLRSYGHKVEVCYGAESAINALKQYLGGTYE